MSDSEKRTLAKFLQIAVPIVGVAIAAISMSLTLATRKRELTCAYLGLDNVVRSDIGGIKPDLKIQYHDRAIYSLLKLRFVLRNTGSAAIKAEDVREPIRLIFPQDVKLLNTVVDATKPGEFAFKTALIPDQNAVTCEFLLLNSGDEAYFSVYAYDSEARKPQLKGRVVDVNRILEADESAVAANPFPFATSRAFREVLYWGVLSFNCLLVGIFVFAILLGFIEYLRVSSWTKQWKPQHERLSADIKRKLAAGQKTDGEAAELARIPRRPSPLYDNWKGALGSNLVFGVLLLFFAVNAIFLWNSRATVLH